MIIITIFAVSIDAYVAGITVGASSARLNSLKLLYISSYSFVIPWICMGIVSFMTLDAKWLNALSACILILLGIKGLLPEKSQRSLFSHREAKQGFVYMTVLGLSLSVDSALCASIFVVSPIAQAVPFILFTMQYGLMFLGQMTAKLIGFAQTISRISNGMLIVIGLARFL